MKTFKEENDDLVKSFFDHTYFQGWKGKILNFGKVELEIGTTCDLACKYCYYHKYGRELYPLELQNNKKILSNLGIFLDWLIENEYKPDIDFFSGEPFSQEIGFLGLKLILDKFKNAKSKPKSIVVPTNYTFLLSKEKTKRVEELLKLSRKLKTPIFLSASFDGKYCEKNRPVKTGEELRDDKYYEKCFAFNKKWSFGFHPMVYSKLIENWQKNFLWFQKMFEKYNIPHWNIYLLEVRNSDWSKKQLSDFIKFIDFLVYWTFKNKCESNKEIFTNFVLNRKGYNILSNSLTKTGRGVGCSIQSTMQIRMGDLSIVPCHRTSYTPFLEAKFKVKNNRINGIESINPEVLIGITSFQGENMPYCENCTIKYLCSKGCMGSQFEINGDMFTPIPTVCKLEHAKIYALLKSLKKYGLYDNIYKSIGSNQKKSFDLVEDLLLTNDYGSTK